MTNGSNGQRKDDEEMEKIITKKEEDEITKEKEKVITKEQVARSPGLRLEAQLPAWPEASHASNVTAINQALMIVRVCVAGIITSFYVKDCLQILSL